MAKTILIADDSVNIQKVVKLTLAYEDEDYEIIAESDGTAAMAKLGELEPDLVIADVHMPGANGYQVCQQVKSDFPGTPVLLLVGTFEHFDDAEAQRVGANAHLKKPFEGQDLVGLVKDLIAQHPVGGGEAAFPDTGPMDAMTVEAGLSAEPKESGAVDPQLTPLVNAETNGHGPLSDDDVDRIARRVVELMGNRLVQEVAWEVVPDMAELVVRERLKQLEDQVE